MKNRNPKNNIFFRCFVTKKLIFGRQFSIICYLKKSEIFFTIFRARKKCFFGVEKKWGVVSMQKNHIFRFMRFLIRFRHSTQLKKHLSFFLQIRTTPQSHTSPGGNHTSPGGKSSKNNLQIWRGSISGFVVI